MVFWKDLDMTTIDFAGARNGTTKFSIGPQPFRFQIPKGTVMYSGLSEYKSMTIEMPDQFCTWWRDTLEPVLASGLLPFSSNLKERGLRLKVDKSTQIFNEERKIQFPELTEGLFGGATVTCIAEISGTYFFKDVYGLTCRIYQIIVHDSVEPEQGETLKGFSFID
jgi:hypothetical protein